MYHAPQLTEVGSVRDLTLGLNPFSPAKDNTAYFPLGNFPPKDPEHPPVGSR